MKKDFQNALTDARKSTSYNPLFAKGYLREAKCHLALGSSNVAKKCLVKVLEIEQNNKQAAAEVCMFDIMLCPGVKMQLLVYFIVMFKIILKFIYVHSCLFS